MPAKIGAMQQKRKFAFWRQIYFFFSLLLALEIIFLTHWVGQTFGPVSMESIMFSMLMPFEGVDSNLIVSAIKSAIFGLTVSFILWLIIKRLFIFFHHSKLGKVVLLAPALLLLLAIFFANQQFKMTEYFSNANSFSSLIDDNYYVPPTDQIIFPAKKKNVVILLLESMENTFGNGQLPVNLTPKLSKLQTKNLSFLRQNQVTGTGWTVAGFTAYLFGLPLKIPYEDHNGYDQRFSTFLPRAASILEVFEANGYNINLMIGSDSNYGGRKNLFNSHCKKANIYDLNYFLEEPHTDSDFFLDWGFADFYLYENAKRLIETQAQDGPFLTVILTINTHVQPDSDQYDKDNFIMADKMATDFLAWLKKQDFYEDTVVMVMGDHLYMHPRIAQLPLIDVSPRHIYNTFLNTGLPPVDESLRQRPFSSLDMAPTILEAAGAQVPQGRFGLGVSLFNKEPNLIERYGLLEVNEHLKRRSKRYDTFF